MAKYLSIICTFFIFFCLSCNKKKNEIGMNEKNFNLAPIIVDISMNSKGVLVFDSLIELKSIVKLETTNENLVGSISNLLFTKNRIIAVDREVSKSITVYDSSGKFLNKVGALGQGPEEYIYMWQASLVDSTCVSIMDMQAQKRKVFDLNGKYISSLDIPYWSSYHEFFEDMSSVCFAARGISEVGKKGELPTLVICNLNKDIIFKGFPSEETDHFRITTFDPLKRIGNKIFLNLPYTDTIFQVKPDGIIPYYYLNIEGKTKIELKDKENEDLFDQKINSMPAHFTGDFVELDDYAVFYIREPEAKWPRFAIYSKQQKKTYYCSGRYYDARLRFFIEDRFYYQGNTLVTPVNASTLLMFKDELYRFCNGKKKEIDELLSDLTEDSNPVLFFYNIKAH